MKFRNVEKKRLVFVVLAVIMMGFCLSFLNCTGFGTDPCTCMNLGISETIGWTLGTWQATLNCIMLVIVFLFARNQIGWGTIANMFLVGYSFDFFSWLWNILLPANFFEGMAVRVLVTVPALVVFVFAAAAYMAVELGTAPYDAIPFLIAEKGKRIPFRVVRICWDMAACAIGVFLGSTLGVVTVIMALTLGPVITWVKEHIIEKYLFPA